MRPLSKLEKEFINHILILDKKEDLIYIHNVLSEFYDKNFEIEFISYEKDLNKQIDYIVKLRYKKDQYVRLNGIIGDLISLTYFIEYLLENGYLVREKISDILGHRFINQFEDRKDIGEYPITSETIKTKFAENLQFKFYATELLRELKANDFEPFEKKEAKVTRSLAIAGLIIAILSVVLSTIIPLLSNDPIEIDKRTIDYFINSEKQIHLIDSTINRKPH